mmetsp:Transcript_12285/g.25169  ORF Transcript_12285/g.25169 Transcript_12285/m.25169 type:complete len:100 (-) Transcript_12285:48-347(-)
MTGPAVCEMQDPRIVPIVLTSERSDWFGSGGEEEVVEGVGRNNVGNGSERLDPCGILVERLQVDCKEEGYGRPNSPSLYLACNLLNCNFDTRNIIYILL